MTTLTTDAPAKINLFLDVPGQRSDGYHDIETVFYPLPGLADTITVEIDRSPGVTIVCDNPAVPVDADNSCLRAAEAFAAVAGVRAAWRITIKKRIPVAAGLGGGSSDAAAVLRLLDRAHDAPLGIDALHAIAVRIGADIPFFLDASRPALAGGIGEELEPLPRVHPLPLVLLCPGFPVSAAWAYANLARMRRPPPPVRAAEFATLLPENSTAKLAAAVYNALEYAVFDKFPLVKILRDFLLKSGALCAHVSGSGPTVFGLFDDRIPDGIEKRARDTFGSFLGVWAAIPT